MEIDLSKLTPNIRRLNDIENVLADKNFAKTAHNKDLYYMYRGLEEKNGLRYDITILNSTMLGKEFNKTKGHYHPGAYPELYMVLDGEAIYLLQKRKNDSDDEIEDVFAIHVKAGECAIMPPFYGHVTINPLENTPLKMANWVSNDFNSIYSPYENLRGACYYYVKQNNEAKWIKNINYKSIPELRFEKSLKVIPSDLNFLRQG